MFSKRTWFAEHIPAKNRVIFALKEKNKNN